MANTNWRRIRKWTLLVAAIGLTAVLVVSWVLGGRLVAPANRVVGDPPSDFPASTVQIESKSGSKIAGWHLRLDGSRATAILLHPIRADRRAMLSRAKLLREHGYSTLLIDQQAHGESSGKHITVGHLEKHDVSAAVEYVKQMQPDQKIAIIGRSLGGAATVFANPDVDVIVLESVYSTVSDAVHNRIQMRLGILHHVFAPLLLAQLEPRLGIAPDELCPIKCLTNIKCPLLIAAGDSDKHTTINETHRLFSEANEPKSLVIFEGAEHVDLLAYDPLKYENEVIGYMNDVIENQGNSDD